MTTVSKKVEVSVSGLDLARRPHGASSGSAEGQTESNHLPRCQLGGQVHFVSGPLYPHLSNDKVGLGDGYGMFQL